MRGHSSHPLLKVLGVPVSVTTPGLPSIFSSYFELSPALVGQGTCKAVWVGLFQPPPVTEGGSSGITGRGADPQEGAGAQPGWDWDWEGRAMVGRGLGKARSPVGQSHSPLSSCWASAALLHCGRRGLGSGFWSQAVGLRLSRAWAAAQQPAL